MEFFLKGLAAGFIIAVPLGPVSILCFRRILTGGIVVGLCTVWGAAAADTIYGLMSALGLHAVTHTLLTHKAPLRIAGGLFLLGFGIAMIRSRPSEKGGDGPGARTPPGAFFSAFVLMLANPTVIITFLAVFATLDLSAEGALYRQGAKLGAGIFLGSSAWWGIYKLASLPFRDRIETRELRLINWVTGSLVCAFGLWQLLDLIRGK